MSFYNGSERALQFRSEVETEVMRTGLYDFDAAHGAGLVAESDKFRPLFPSQFEGSAMRIILGVTVVSLNFDDEVTFRTATFGTDDPEFINQIDAVGTSSVVQAGSLSDKSPKTTALQSSRQILGAYRGVVSDGLGHTLGGSIIRSGEKSGTIEEIPFISGVLAKYFEDTSKKPLAQGFLRAGRLISRKSRENHQLLTDAGISHAQFVINLTYPQLTAKARKRGGPIIVERPFAAKVPLYKRPESE